MEDLYESLAAWQHVIWSHWMLYVLGTVGQRQANGDLVIPANYVDHWRRQIETPYEYLSDREKASDREQVDRFWPLVAP